jgi:glyoxylase-like metal-dependent hydrolase (beta-lactamase superfamily II)
MSLVRVSEGVYVLEGRTNVGVVVLEGGECLVVDTGVDRDQGRRVLRAVRDAGLRVRAVVNTHSHADHIGGNRVVMERTGATFYSSILERPLIELPLVEVVYLYGAYPPEVLRTHLVEAEGVPVDDISRLVREYPFLRVVELPGHSVGMVGLGIGRVLFSADAFFPEEVLAKYVVPYHLNVQEALGTLRRLSNEVVKNYDVVVPSHGRVLSRVEAQRLVELNANTILKIREYVLRNTGGSLPLVELLKLILRDLNLVPQTVISYLLTTSALKSYIAWLANEGLVELLVSGGELYVRGPGRALERG